MGEPEGVVAEADGVAAWAGPLADYGVGGGRDLREGNVDDRGPDEARAESDFAAVPGDSRSDGSHDFARADVDASDGAVALVEGPDGASAGGEETWLRADWNLGEDLASAGVCGSKDVGLNTGDPDEAFGVERICGTGRNGNLPSNRVGDGVDAEQRAVLIGGDPDGVFAGGDAAFIVGGAEGERGGDFVVRGSDAGERGLIAAERNPESAEGEDEAGAGLGGKIDFGGDGICYRR
jgi:hypothetical protein